MLKMFSKKKSNKVPSPNASESAESSSNHNSCFCFVTIAQRFLNFVTILFYESVYRIFQTKMDAVDNTIEVHPLTQEPTVLWGKIEKSQKVEKVEPLPLTLPICDRKVRFVCISDTHSRVRHLKADIPYGDILIHAGDFSLYGDRNEVENFNKFLGSLPHPYKVVIAGNHELSFDPNFNSDSGYSKKQPNKAPDVKAMLTNCCYLEDSGVDIYGIKIYGSPWQPLYMDWAFNLPRGAPLLKQWNKIPDIVDVLVTHTPPLGHGDHCVSGVRAGCVELLNSVEQRIKPKYHIFGHIHEGYGITTNGVTTFINAAICNVSYKPVNLPIIFDIQLPEGLTKKDLK